MEQRFSTRFHLAARANSLLEFRGRPKDTLRVRVRFEGIRAGLKYLRAFREFCRLKIAVADGRRSSASFES